MKPESVSTKQERIATLARENPTMAFTSLNHYLDVEWMEYAFKCTRKDGAVGVDGQTAEGYAANLRQNLLGLIDRLKSGRYRAPPVRRHYIDKAGGGQRGLGIPSFEDKVAQRAIVMLLEPIYEQTFIGCSFGYRPGRNAHQALQVLRTGVMRQRGHWVLEVDIRRYFDSIAFAPLREILAKRVTDGVVRRLIDKWLKAGVLEAGQVHYPEAGTPQGGVITPLTQKITFSSSTLFPAGEADRSLICDARNIILMSHGEIHAGAKGENPERGISTSLAASEHSRIGGGAIAREFDFTAPGISVSRTSRSAGRTGRGERACAAGHVQNSRRCYSHPAYVCRSQRSDLERGFDARHHGVRGACFSAWVSGVARPTFVSNMPSIVCSPPSSNESMKSSFPTVYG